MHREGCCSSLAFSKPVKSRSGCSQRSHFALLALRCLAITHILVVSAAHAQGPATIGQFSPVMTWPFKAVHANLLPTGKVLWWPSFDNGDNPTIWDPSTNTNTAV